MTAGDIIGLVGIILGSTGLWTLVTKIIESRSNKKKKIDEKLDKVSAVSLGLAYDRCKYVAEEYIKRGWITSSEHADYLKYLYEPYKALGGDGTIDKLKAQLDSLPIDSQEP